MKNINKKTIIFSNYDDIINPFYGGGAITATHQIARSLVAKYNVKVICSIYKDSKNGFVDGVYYKHIGSGIFGPKFSQILFSLLLPFHSMTESYDVWIENFVAPHSTNFLPLFSKKPVIGVASLLNAVDFSKKYHLPFQWVEDLGLKTYKYFIALNKYNSRKIISTNPEAKVIVLPRGVDKKLLNLKTKEKGYVLFLGRLDIYQKGLDMLLDSWSKVRRKNRLRLLIAGKGLKKDVETIYAIIDEYKLNDSVVLLGEVSGESKEKLIAESLLMVCPSRFEGFGNSALEALAVGKPLICFDVPGFTWIPKGVCIKIKAFDERELSNQIISVLENPKLRKEMGYKARNFAKQFSWEKVAVQYEKFITDVYNQSIVKDREIDHSKFPVTKSTK